MRAATPRGDLGTLPPLWTMGTGFEVSTLDKKPEGPPPTPTAAWTTSPWSAARNSGVVTGDVARSAPSSNSDYGDLIEQIGPHATEVQMQT